jgi:hypothetical protein
MDENTQWLVYRAHTHTNWTIQQEDIVRLWYTRKQPKTPKIKIVGFKVPNKEKKYNVYLPDSNGIMQRVYSTNSEKDKIRFENTNKYRSSLNGGLWYFV